MDQDAHMKRIIENLSSDLNTLSSETKRKFASVKDASEGCLLKLRQVSNQKTNLYKIMCESSPEIIRPLTLGCETKQPKIIQICLTSVQKVIEARILNQNSASMLINTLWTLTDAGLEELKVLQTIILLVTTTDVVKHQLLAKTLTIGLRIAASKDQILMNTATAMLSQMITKVFERVVIENKSINQANQNNLKPVDFDQLKVLSKEPPSWMNESAQDAYMLLQDIYLLLNSDQSLWLINISEINKPFGLEILKSILVRYPEIFFYKPEMSFILKERICPLLIKLFSPSTKTKPTGSNANSPSSPPSSQTSSQNQQDQKNFTIVSRLIRIIYVLVKNYFDLLITESEIFLSLLTKFLDNDRPLWQKALSIEVFHKISTEPTLIEQLVLNYDMKQQPEKLFYTIINSISLFMQSLFLNSTNSNQNQQIQQQNTNSSNTQQFSYQISSAQPSFIFKDTNLQLLYPYTSGQIKSLYLEGSDKLEIPYFPDGYLLSIGFSTLQELCKTIQLIIEQNLNQYLNSQNGIPLKRFHFTQEHVKESKNLSLCLELMNSSSNSLLFIYNLLLDTSLDETVTEQILKSLKILIHVTSVLNLNTQRDSFVTCICKSALPFNYTQYVLNLKLLGESGNYRSEQADKQSQIVAVGSSLSQNSPPQLYITAKNLLTMKSILNMANLYSELLGSSWYILLNTLQHLTWTLGLKPTIGSNGALKHINASPVQTDTSMIFTAVQTDIAFICNLLTKLFESTRLISDQALEDVIDSLLKLSIECSDMAYLKNEPCLFPISKLYETIISNLNRLDLFWENITRHFLCGCKHTSVKYREWCVDSICNLIRATFNYKYSNNTSESNKISRDIILQPLDELSNIQFNDVRQKQIECTLSILRLMGQHLNESWPVCLNIIGAIQKEHTDILVRSAFQCLQLVVTDFLSMIKAQYLSLVINVVAKFGSQEQDLNISLTAIVLLWNISDFMFQRSDELNKDLKLSESDSIESIWMVLYSRLGNLCVDPRPAVRKSACQTLFCTISSHGSVLNVDLHWKDLVWTVLFPLLEQVRHFTNTASRERDKLVNHPNFLMHHSRDTAEKQWAETSVLTLSGVTRVFNSKYSVLMKLSNGEFHKMWLFLLGIIENLALSKNSEISSSALRGFHELLGSHNYFSSASSFGQGSNSAQSVAAAAAAATVILPNSGSEKSDSSSNIAIKNLDISEWLAAWKTWLNIGNTLSSSMSIPEYWPPPGQTFLTCYVDLVFVIVDKLAPTSKFTTKDFENFSIILDKLLSIPVLSSDYSSFILMQTDTNLIPLQNSSLNTLKNFIKLFKTSDPSFQNTFISLVFQRLLSFVLFACYNNNTQTNNERSGKPNEIVNVNYVPFGERALIMVTNLYEETASHESVIENCILKSIIQTLYVPLSLKYSCPNPSTWKLSIECLFKILKKALPITFKRSKNFDTMWLDLANTFEDFLFSKNVSTNDLPLETIQKDELIDCQVIDLIGNDILTHASQVPQQFVQKILSILNRGSIYSNTFENFLDLDSSRKLREEFSKSCFETLLRFSFVNTNESSNDANLTRMALTSMLNRCREIIQKYSHDERLNGTIPLPKTNEMIGVLKALCTLMSALKKAPKDSIQPSIWNQVIGLYPSLVECTSSPSTQICGSVKEALHHYFSLLKAP
ncbi:unnamed protein product [Brachionus calyciflorus]|uniref:Protein MON2 homolog n=1 Tax=Brachionus calyciflorus TaxID=104777 RepID=A0A813M183_9BILA|nr:unnamed protein product [Brachionus calyciflorus]